MSRLDGFWTSTVKAAEWYLDGYLADLSGLRRAYRRLSVHCASLVAGHAHVALPSRRDQFRKSR